MNAANRTGARRTRIALSALRHHVTDMIDEARPCRPGDEDGWVIIDTTRPGVVDLVDGYHRTAGWARWAREQGKADAMCPVIDAAGADPALVAAAAEPGPRQREAIEALIAEAEEAE